MVNEPVPVQPFASRAVTFGLNVPEAVGEPVMRPLDEISIPEGAPEIKYVYGEQPPDALAWIAVIALPTVAVTDPEGSPPTAIVGQLTFILNEPVPVPPPASRAVTTMLLNVPVAVGVPLIRPLDEPILMPEGAPEIAYVYGGRPQAAEA